MRILPVVFCVPFIALSAGFPGAGPAWGQPPAKDVVKAVPARFDARLSPGQVAVYQVVETDSAKEGAEAEVKSRVRVEVLRFVEGGILVRGTDFWEGKDKSVQPRIMGETEERTREVTFDVVLPWDGGEAVAADREAALAEMVGAGVRDQREKGANQEKLKVMAENMRGLLGSSTAVDGSVNRQFAMLFDGLGGGLVAGESKPETKEIQVGAYSLKSTKKTVVAVEASGKAVREAYEVIPASEQRRLIRDIAEREAKAQNLDLKVLEKALEPRLAAQKDSVTRAIAVCEPASGWPVEVKWTSESQSKGKDVRKSRTLTLVEGPEPAIPAPVGAAKDAGSDAYIGWLTGLVGAKEPPVRLYGRFMTDSLSEPTASQRKLLLDAAVAAGPGEKNEEPPAVTFAGAGSVGLKSADLDAVSAAYAKLSPEGRRAVLVNVVRVEEAWGEAFFARLLAMSATEKELDGLPLRVVEKSPKLANRALKTALAVSKAGAFDWDVLYAGYSLDRAETLDAGVRDALLVRAAAVLGRQVELAKPKQQVAHGNWVYGDDYGPVNALMALAADILGDAKGSVGLAELRECAKLIDERAAGFAVAGLVNRGEKVDTATLERVCRGATGWHAVVSQLEAGKASVLPEGARTLEMAARADMVRWLVYPTELGQEPEAIELVKAVDGDGGAGKERYYIFKFRSDGKAFKEKGWMMGLSGPWNPSKPFTQPAGGHTFSEFEPIGKSTAEEQAAGIIKKLEEAWKKEAERAQQEGDAKKEK